MDQAASVISVPSSALYISFFPELSASAVPLPPGAVFIIANSLVVSDKAVTAKRNYNLRVVETLAAARILARRLGVKVEKDEKVTLREVVGRLAGEVEEAGEMPIEWLSETLRRMEREAEGLKSKEAAETGQLGVSMEEMIEMSGLSTEEFNQVYLSWVEGKIKFPSKSDSTKNVYNLRKSKQPTSSFTNAPNMSFPKPLESFNSAKSVSPQSLKLPIHPASHHHQSTLSKISGS